jgi:ferric-dicitrate binding protein FerR (iron transport regulator)
MKEATPIGLNPEDEQSFRIAYLVAGFIRQTLTESENIELDDWVTANMDNQHLFEQMIDEKNQSAWLKQIDKVDSTAALESIKGKISFMPGRKKSTIRSLWVYAIALCLVLGLMISFLLISKDKTTQPAPMVQLNTHDIAPGLARATLTLSDGRPISLDSLKNGRLLSQNNTPITKLDSGALIYQLIEPTILPQTESYNILSTPAGGQYKVVLPDGTKVWLNASSSLRYPTVFGGAKRKVALTGEGYFEVAKDPMYPFEISANGSTVQVLGTHFNINAYTDEPLIKIALAEGAIRLNNRIVLRPGEQGSVSKNGNIEKGKADLEATLAWKNGQFIFKETPIGELMRQVARWYHAGIIYNIKINQHFNATIPRNVPVSKLLHLLEATGAVHFKISNNTITVMK